MPFTLQGFLQGQKKQNELKILLQVWVIITKAQGQEEKWNLCWSCHRSLFYRLWIPRRQRLPLFHFLFIEHSTNVDAGERARFTVLKKRSLNSRIISYKKKTSAVCFDPAHGLKYHPHDVALFFLSSLFLDIQTTMAMPIFCIQKSAWALP